MIKVYNNINIISSGGTPLHYASSAGTVGLLLANGADPTLRMRDPPISSFDSFLERMPEGCNIILNSYLKSNGKSAGAADFEITMNYALFLRAHKQCPGSLDSPTFEQWLIY